MSHQNRAHSFHHSHIVKNKGMKPSLLATGLNKMSAKVSEIDEKYAKKYIGSDPQKFFHYICSSKAFFIVVTLSIILNTVAMSMDRYPIDEKENQVLEEINSITTWVFVGELIIKVLGLGVKAYVSDSMNQFDAIVVIISIVEIVLQNSQNKDSEN